MGSPPAPSYANIFMAMIYQIIERLECAEAIELLMKFLVDYFLIFVGSTKELHEHFERINRCHPTMKFTINHTSLVNEPLEDKCGCPDISFIPFLDVKCSLAEGKINTDLYRKETDRNQYLLPSSSHRKQTIKANPKS